MRKEFIYLLIVIITQNAFGQKNDTLFLLVEKPYYQYESIEKIEIGFAIVSEDKRFVCDYYKFGVLNYMGWDREGNDVYLNLQELGKKTDINTISFETIKSFTDDKEWWRVHNELSLKKKIFLIEKRKTDFNPSTNDFKYYTIPLIYKGTRKNIVPTDLSLN